MSMKVRLLPNLPTKLRNALACGDYPEITISELAELSRIHGDASPYRFLALTPNVGPTALAAIFDALFFYAVSLEANPQALRPIERPETELALQVVCALITRTTGDVGGRDQGRNFAEIAHDFLDALRLEAIRRE